MGFIISTIIFITLTCLGLWWDAERQKRKVVLLLDELFQQKMASAQNTFIKLKEWRNAQ